MTTLEKLNTLRTPPHNIEVEFCIIGAILTSGPAMDEASDFITADMFYRRENRSIYEICEIAADKGQTIDTVSIAEALNNSGLLEQIGGVEYLAELSTNGRGTANLLHYFQILKNKWIEREILRASYLASDAVYSGESTEDKLHAAQAAIMAVGDETEKSDLVHVSQVISSTIDEIDRRANAGSGMVGLSTGFIDLDKVTGGFEPGNLIILAARPSMGKTSLAMNIAENAAIAGKRALIFSLEMPREALMMRSVSSIGRILHDKVRTGKLAEDDWSRLTYAVGKIKDSKLWIDDTAALTTTSLRSKARRYTRRFGKPEIIIVDYIQIMGNKVNGNDTSRITEISRDLKAIAKEFNCPVLALSQLNRAVDARDNKRPRMSDLRDSGALEQDADVVMFMYRDEYYDDNSPHKGIAECIIAKQRNGPTGKIYLTSELDYVRFSNFSGRVPEMSTYRGNKTAADFLG